MKHIVLGLFAFILLGLNGVNANVDQTNAFEFEYNCTASGGILKTDFNLGGHHHYYREYKIDNPGIIEIADHAHTTVAKSTNISIDGCNYQPTVCTPVSEGEWEYISGEDIDFKSLLITTELNDDLITRSGARLVLAGSGTSEGISIDFEVPYSSTGKTLTLETTDSQIVLKEEGFDELGNHISAIVRQIDFENKQYLGEKEFYYEYGDDDKSIVLKRKRFTRVSEGLARTSENTYDVFSAVDGTNTGGDSCVDPEGQSNNGYCTGLDFWDYTQHNYTTTKIKLHSDDMACSLVEFSDLEDPTITSSYDGTLSGITHPLFDGPVSINGTVEGDWGTTLYAFDDSLDISGLKYSLVGKVGDVVQGVEKIEVSIKENDITLGLNSWVLSNIKDTAGEFEEFSINLEDFSGENVMKNIGNYQLVFTFISNSGQQLGTYGLPVTVIPNNNLELNGSSVVNLSSVFADGSSVIQVCQGVLDDLGNPITRDYSRTQSDVVIEDGISLDKTNPYSGEALTVSNVVFSNSRLCFNLDSLAPDKKIVGLKISIPNHIQDISLDEDGANTYFSIATPVLEYKKIYRGVLEIDELVGVAQKVLQIGNTYNLETQALKEATVITDVPSLSGLQTITFSDGHIANNQLDSNTKTSFDFNYGGSATIAPSSFDLEERPYISYRIGSSDLIKYRLTPSVGGNDIDPLTYSVGAKFLGVKVLGNLQGEGKQEITGQESNISDISSLGLRGNIRSNAFSFIKSMNHNQVVNDVKYVEGDYDLSGDISDYETLVLKNGNLTISGDLNMSNKKLGIIILKDNYNIGEDAGEGNIIISPGVKYVNATMYADGGLMTLGESQLQLYIKGSLFTRNTIGGSIGTSGTFLLPGGESTSDYDLSKLYDLNHVRMGNSGWDTNGNGIQDNEEEENATLIIKYNSNLQNNPPKIFKN